MRNPEVFWNADTAARAFDVPRRKLLELLRLELVPVPVVLRDECLWHAPTVRQWAAGLEAANPAQAVAALWARWQDEMLADVRKGGA